MQITVLPDGSLVRKCSMCDLFVSKTLPVKYLSSKVYLCESCYNINASDGNKFDLINQIHHRIYRDAKKYKIMKIEKRIPDNPIVYGSSNDIEDAINFFTKVNEHYEWTNQEVCIEWNIDRKHLNKKTYIAYQNVTGDDMATHPLFEALQEKERDFLCLFLLFNNFSSDYQLKLYSTYSYTSLVDGNPQAVARISRPKSTL